MLGVVLSGMDSLIGSSFFSGASVVHYVGAVIGPSITPLPDGAMYLAAVPDAGTVYPGVWDGATTGCSPPCSSTSESSTC